MEGTVLLEAVVLTNGQVGDVRIIRSLDSRLGLDDQAVKALRAWRFNPGTHEGHPVPVIVTVELTFRL
jgi:periplasmic protein TonB